MSTSSPTIDSFVSLNHVVNEINRYFATIVFIFGTVGNLLNISVLSQKLLRANPCAVLFCGSSVAGLISLVSGLTSRVLSAWTADLSETVRWLCKILGSSLFTFRCIAFWLIISATVDRWLLSSTNVHRRNLSTVKVLIME